MVLASFAVLIGLIILVWSADIFIEGAAGLAQALGMSPLLIGIIIIGFGTSAPELLVSAISSLNHAPAVALGNAYGSDITNIALILGVTAFIKPIAVNSNVLKTELPILLGVTLISAYLLSDHLISRADSGLLLGIFTLYMAWSIWKGTRTKQDPFALDMQEELAEIPRLSTKKASLYMLIGLILLMASSQALVWGATEIAQYFGVSDLIIGLTIVAIGTSLPELATSIMAAKKGETDLAVGNIIGSNIFNTLPVVGIAGIITPFHAGPEVFYRDMMVIIALTTSLFVLGYGFNKKQGMISRFDGFLLLLAYLGYNAFLLKDLFHFSFL